MKYSTFLREWAQGDLFPDRSTVGCEIVAEMVATHKVSGHSTEVVRRLSYAKTYGRQRPLPLIVHRRESK